jgi:hypothetical protein
MAPYLLADILEISTLLNHPQAPQQAEWVAKAGVQDRQNAY